VEQISNLDYYTIFLCCVQNKVPVFIFENNYFFIIVKFCSPNAAQGAIIMQANS